MSAIHVYKYYLLFQCLYGPPTPAPSFDNNLSMNQHNSSSSFDATLQTKIDKLQNLVRNVRRATDPQHVPSLLTRHMEFLLSLSPSEMSACLDAIRSNVTLQEEVSSQDEVDLQETEQAIDLILSFAQDFCDEAARVYDKHRNLLGRIISAMAVNEIGVTAGSSGSSTLPLTTERREERLDELLAAERQQLTPGFLRHLSGECERIANAPRTTPDSLRLLETLRTLQARVVDEMGRDLSESAQVIMQLLNYDTKSERLAVLEAGLQVRGIDFAREILTSTEEALKGFDKVGVAADPELVERVQEIHQRTMRFLNE
ncbi:hypothetical protein MPSEU_000356100 [Mayamaea pseudoterrestris]|nr:hypothetical protein MPSEU_000356100 [Mayamaea pseudoterrestris]